LKIVALLPHRQKNFKISTDPFLVKKIRDFDGLYLNPPDKAVVLYVDEKTQVQALDRTQPVLPMGLAYLEGVTHDYIRHGTTTLFAALDVATGEVVTQCKPRHRHQEFLAFLREIEKSVPTDPSLHLIVDNYATHKHLMVKTWLAQRPRFHIHFTPTYASWLNRVERWLALITERAIRRWSFSSVRQLIARIGQFVATHNKTTAPITLSATADSILEKIQRLCSCISGTAHQPLIAAADLPFKSRKPCWKASKPRAACPHGCVAGESHRAGVGLTRGRPALESCGAES
jgi:putative transposase